jgi:hypothetical protein
MVTRRTNTARIALITGLLVSALALVPVASAGKGGGGGSTTSSGGTSLTGPVMVLDNNGDRLPNRYDEITFNVSTSATATPEVGLRCYQGSAWVFDGYVGYFPGYLFDRWFTLNSNYWVDGASTNCTARLFYRNKRGQEVVLSTLSFSVAP